jgi:RES domain-containing protein
MTVGWRLLPRKHQRDAFSGEGARIAAGRWNARGTRAVYLSGSVSLAALETLLHAGRAALTMPFVIFRVEIPDDLEIESILADKLPNNWRQQPAPDSTRRLGSEWVARGAAVALRLPSVLVPEEYNLLLNPSHPDFAKLRISKPQVFTFSHP